MGINATNVETSPNGQLSADAEVSPSVFRGACVDLLCRLENRMAQIGATKAGGASFEKLETAKLMLVDLIDFAEANLSAEQVDHLTPLLQDVFERTKQLEEVLQKTSWGLMQRFISREKSSRFEVDAAYEELSTEYVRLFVVFFVECMKHFQGTPTEKRNMLDSVEAFMDEVARRW